MLAFAMTVAIVVADPTHLTASPEPDAARQALLARGDWLEVRGELRGRLKVYDHRRERPGYVEPWQVREFALDESSAPALRALIDFLRDTPGSESLGIGVTALYLKVAPADQVGADALGALGLMADRLARRASGKVRPGEATAAHLEVAESYGVKFVTVETEAGMRVCYDGEALRRVVALPASPELKARAALALTDARCAPPTKGPTEQKALVEWQLDVLARADGAPAWLAGRARLRRAGLLATLAYLEARRGDAQAAAADAGAALDAFAGVTRTELAPGDEALWNEAAVKVATARWLRETSPPAAGSGRIRVELAAGQPGETCVRLVEGKLARAERCTYGLVSSSSVRLGPHEASVALSVQPLPGWLELWLFRRAGDGWAPAEGRAGSEATSQWIVDVLTPSESSDDVGYAELAGFSPDGKRVLVVREAVGAGGLRRTAGVLLAGTLAVERSARSPDVLGAFQRWGSADWRRATLALR